MDTSSGSSSAQLLMYVCHTTLLVHGFIRCLICAVLPGVIAAIVIAILVVTVAACTVVAVIVFIVTKRYNTGKYNHCNSYCTYVLEK